MLKLLKEKGQSLGEKNITTKTLKNKPKYIWITNKLKLNLYNSYGNIKFMFGTTATYFSCFF